MISLDIEPQYLPQDDSDHDPSDSALADQEQQLEEEYGEEELNSAEFARIKKSNVFQPIDYSKRKAKIVGTLG